MLASVTGTAAAYKHSIHVDDIVRDTNRVVSPSDHAIASARDNVNIENRRAVEVWMESAFPKLG